jgi:anhydro-N-acetylmuramic acid kinase
VKGRGRAKAGAPWRRFIGVMSGTSLDGVDAVVLALRGEPPKLQWKLEAHHAAPFHEGLRARLRVAAEGEPIGVPEIARLHYALGETYAACVTELLGKADLDPAEVAGIGLSGQTLHHQSAREAGTGGVTLQLGSAAVVAERCGVRVVSDVRAADVAAGGEGAPLVPYADWLLFRSNDEGRVILNVGGIANLTAIPRAARAEDVVAFDTGPGNMVMDGIVQSLSGESYDADGERAARGSVNEELLRFGLADPFFAMDPPRSTGRERFGRAFVERWIFEGRAHGASDDDLVATAATLTAQSVADSVHRFVKAPVQSLYVAGGGAHNAALLEQLSGRLEPIAVDTTAELGMPVECREAAAFAVIAHETMAGRPSNLPQVTGAARALALGNVSAEPRR